MKEKWRLRFEPEMERLYEEETAKERSRQLYVRGYPAIFVYLLFLIPDHYMIPDIYATALIVRLGIITPLLIIGMIFQKSNPPALIRERAESALIFLTALSLIFLISRSQCELSVIYHPGVSLVLIFANLVVRLRFHHGVIISFAVFFMYIAFIPFYAGNSLAIQVFNLSFLLSNMIFSIFANYSLEKEKRKNFLLIYREKKRGDSLSEENTELQSLSEKDSLTGLSNRRAMENFVIRLLSGSPLEKSLEVILIDVDFFKKYNDTYGHQAGDTCLKAVGHTLESIIRKGHDQAARYGGEEFILILPTAEIDKLHEITQRLIDEIGRLAIPHGASPISPYVTASFGIAHGELHTYSDMENLIRRADKALYKAKTEGRNRACFYSDPDQPTLSSTGGDAN